MKRGGPENKQEYFLGKVQMRKQIKKINKANQNTGIGCFFGTRSLTNQSFYLER
jgi:hypothetical protein